VDVELDVEPHSPLRVEFYRFVHAVWQHWREGRPLTGDARLYARVLARYPQWAHYWEMADDLGDIQVLTPEGLAPFAILALDAASERPGRRQLAA